MPRVVAVPVIDRSAALIVSGLAALVTAQLLLDAALGLGLGTTDPAMLFVTNPRGAIAASVLAVVGWVVALSGGVTFLVGAYRAAANLDRYLAFRVAILPRRVETPAPAEATREASRPDLDRASGPVR